MRKIFTAFAAVLCMAGCTKEIPDAPAQTDLMKVDLTGYWNAYGYVDFSGLVPLEIIQVTKNDSGKYIATKIKGDNAVPTGMVTWRGYFTSNPFKVDFIIGDGTTTSVHPWEITVESENVLALPAYKIKYVRRTDGYFP